MNAELSQYVQIGKHPADNRSGTVHDGIQALYLDGREAARRVINGEKLHTSALVIHASLLWQFPHEVEQEDIRSGMARAMKFQEVAIGINEETDIGVSAEIARRKATGEQFSGLLSLQNALSAHVDNCSQKFVAAFGKEHEIPINAFRNDALRLSRNRHTVGDKITLSEYLDIDSAIHEVAFTNAVAPPILAHAGIDPTEHCESIESLREKYGIFLSSPDDMSELNEAQLRLAVLHAFSMQLKIFDDSADLAGPSSTDMVLDIPSFSLMDESEKQKSISRYSSLIGNANASPVAGEFALYLFRKRTFSKLHTLEQGAEITDQEPYSAAQTVRNTGYTSTLRQALDLQGSLDPLFMNI